MGLLAPSIRSLGGRPVAVAVTATFAQQAFGASLGLDFPLLSDWEGTTAAVYGVRYDHWKGHAGVAKRSVFVIDRGGVIRYRWVTEDALVLPDFAEAMAVLGALERG